MTHQTVHLPRDTKVCGNCIHWVGARFQRSNGTVVCLQDSAGHCQNRRVHDGLAGEETIIKTPVESANCGYWQQA